MKAIKWRYKSQCILKSYYRGHGQQGGDCDWRGGRRVQEGSMVMEKSTIKKGKKRRNMIIGQAPLQMGVGRGSKQRPCAPVQVPTTLWRRWPVCQKQNQQQAQEERKEKKCKATRHLVGWLCVPWTNSFSLHYAAKNRCPVKR